MRWWKDGEILEEGNELIILETEPGEGGGFYWTFRKKLYFLNILLDYVNISFTDFSNRSLIDI